MHASSLAQVWLRIIGRSSPTPPYSFNEIYKAIPNNLNILSNKKSNFSDILYPSYQYLINSLAASMGQIKIADYLFRRLKQLGIESIFGVPGGELMRSN